MREYSTLYISFRFIRLILIKDLFERNLNPKGLVVNDCKTVSFTFLDSQSVLGFLISFMCWEPKENKSGMVAIHVFGELLYVYYV